ncbi:hypothetical protein K525DRAFT_275716 [Schizophyllum commune Loenen D]|nr:hypothetical protein K525DRAFT_275716 [Schizophyllum commune Loenen D]
MSRPHGRQLRHHHLSPTFISTDHPWPFVLFRVPHAPPSAHIPPSTAYIPPRRPKVRRRRAIDTAYTQPPRANLTRRPPHTSRRSHLLPPPPPSTFRFPAAFDLPRRPPLSTPVPSPLRITHEIVALDASIAHHQRTA